MNPLAPEWLDAPADASELLPGVWPASAEREGGGIRIAGVAATELAARYGTPLYVVDEGDFRRRADAIRAAFDRELSRVGSSAKVYYAAKAFLSAEVARWVTEAGLGIDVCSGGELAVALAAGVDAARLGFHGNNKSVAEIDRAVSAGVGVIVIDSTIEIDRVADAAARHGRTQRVRLRVNSGVHASTHEYLATAREDQKFGIALADTAKAVAAIRARPTLEFLGLHSHIGSQIFETDGFEEAARRLIATHHGLLAGGPVPELNLGGGFGIAYTAAEKAMPVEEIARRFADVVSVECERRGIRVPVVAIEPGRVIAGPPGVTLYEVGTIKDVVVDVAAPAWISASSINDAPLVEPTPLGISTGSINGSSSVEPTPLGIYTGSINGSSSVEPTPLGIYTGSINDAPLVEPTPLVEPVETPPVETYTAIRKYVSVDGGMSDNLRPALYAADYSVRIANRISEADPALVRVVGKHCESGDIVVRADYLPSDVAPGDLLAVPVTGAYCWSLASNYNYLGRAPVVAVRDGVARVIVRGETEHDLLARDAGIVAEGEQAAESAASTEDE